MLVVDAGELRNAPASGVHGFLTRDGPNPVARGIAVVEGEVASLEIVEDRLAGVRAGAAINADLIAENTERAVTAYRARREALTAGWR